LRPVGDGVKRLAHDADLKGMVVIRSPLPQLVPFKLHRFGQQRLKKTIIQPQPIGDITRLCLLSCSDFVINIELNLNTSTGCIRSKSIATSENINNKFGFVLYEMIFQGKTLKYHFI
jgi:hypothetical protein